MKPVFLLIFFCFSFVCLSPRKSIASVEYILDEAYLGCRTETVEYSGYDSLILFLTDSIKYEEGAEKYKHTREIWGRYIFNIDSCLNMLSIWIGTMSSSRHGDVFESVLFNGCDTSLYLFGEGPDRFSDVLARILSDELSDNDVYEVFGLYINTLSDYSKYLPLRSFPDFKEYYLSMIRLVVDSTNMNENWVRGNWNYETDIALLQDLITPMKIERHDNSIYLQICSWGRQYGNLEFWRIKITQGSFEVFERRELLRGVGPGKFE